MSALGKATGDGALRLSVASVHFETGLISKANSLDMETQMAEASPSGNEVPGPGFRTQKHKNEVESRRLIPSGQASLLPGLLQMALLFPIISSGQAASRGPF